MIELADCDLTERRVPHDPHGWMVVTTGGVTSAPVFAQCTGYVDPAPDPAPDPASLPERAGREGDTQGMPTPNDEVDTQTVAIKMIADRRELGIRRYGTALQPNNGRDSLWDAVEEAVDLLVYLINVWREAHPGEDIPSARS